MTRPIRDGLLPNGPLRSETRDATWSRNDLFGRTGAQTVDHGSQLDADERLVQLARTIELEIIPRLMLAHRAANECPDVRADAAHVVTERDVGEFAKLVRADDEDVALACVQALRDRGVSIESIYIDLLGPAARYLGELWTQDLCDFTEITVALGRMQRMLRELSPAFHDVDEAAPIGRRILLMPCPGEQHTFGLVMVSEFFRRAGWEVSGGSWALGLDAPNMVAGDWFDVVGFSMGAQCHVDALSACIRAVRQNSRNSEVVIMAGGPLFALQPELSNQIGVDVVATDGRRAPVLAEQLVAQRSRVGR